jgi:hypothetical protein
MGRHHEQSSENPSQRGVGVVGRVGYFAFSPQPGQGRASHLGSRARGRRMPGPLGRGHTEGDTTWVRERESRDMERDDQPSLPLPWMVDRVCSWARTGGRWSPLRTKRIALGKGRTVASSGPDDADLPRTAAGLVAVGRTKCSSPPAGVGDFLLTRRCCRGDADRALVGQGRRACHGRRLPAGRHR